MDRLISTDHGRISLSDSGGTGMPLVLLHGSGSSARIFDRQMASPLAKATRMIALDLPGHGRSNDASDPRVAYTLTGLATTVETVLQKLDVRRFALFGWSLGGHVAIEMLARNRGVRGLLLTGTPPVRPGLIGSLRGFHASFDLLLASKQNWSQRDVERFEHLCFGESATPDIRNDLMRADGRLRAAVSHSMMRADGNDQRQTVLSADIPVFFVNGAEDPFIRQSYIAGFEDPTRGHQNHVIESAGHAPFWDRPEEFNLHLGAFLDAVRENAAANVPAAAAG